MSFLNVAVKVFMSYIQYAEKIYMNDYSNCQYFVFNDEPFYYLEFTEARLVLLKQQ